MKILKFISPFLALLISVSASAVTYTIDPAHSQVGFRVKHLVISNVYGRFNKFKGEFDYDPKTGKAGKLKVSIDPATIDTNEADRDKHLRGPDFFDVEKFPTMEFVGKKFEYKDGKPVKVTGDLTMHGKKNPVTLDILIVGEAVDPWGNQKLGFEAKGQLDRKLWGIKWNKALDNGGMTVSDNVDLSIEGEAAVKKK